MYKSAVFLLMFFGIPVLLMAQERPDPRLRYGDLIYAEAEMLPTDSLGTSRVDVFVRVSYDFMIFSRTSSSHPDSLFSAGVEVTYSLKNQGHTVQSENQFVRIAVGDYDTTNLRDQFVLLRHTFHVDPGTYEAAISVSDQGSTRNTSVSQAVTALELSGSGSRIGQPIPLQKQQGHDGDTYSVLAFGRTLPFASVAVIGIPVSQGLEAEWRVQLIQNDEDDTEAVFDDTVQPEARLSAVYPSGQPGVVQNFQLQSGKPADGDIVVLSLPFSKMDVGRYQLHVTASWDGGSDSVSLATEIFWRDMPFSMRDLDFAIDAMRFILTAEEYREMKQGDVHGMQKAFRKFWKERDNTPDTEYNEMMAEYFRRVDQAYYKFQTMYERNGAQTDRGKVYVLFGPPEDTQRILNRGEPTTELWDYPSLGKSFRFVDKSRDGNLRLLEE